MCRDMNNYQTTGTEMKAFEERTQAAVAGHYVTELTSNGNLTEPSK